MILDVSSQVKSESVGKCWTSFPSPGWSSPSKLMKLYSSRECRLVLLWICDWHARSIQVLATDRMTCDACGSTIMEIQFLLTVHDYVQETSQVTWMICPWYPAWISKLSHFLPNFCAFDLYKKIGRKHGKERNRRWNISIQTSLPKVLKYLGWKIWVQNRSYR